jgi:hypothetical protein
MRSFRIWLSLLFLALGRAAAADTLPAVEPVPPVVPLAESDREWVRNEIYVREAERMDRDSPRVQKGDELRLQLLNGNELIGTFVFASSNSFTVVRNQVESRQYFRELDIPDRLRLDPGFREAALKIAALAQTEALLPARKPAPSPRTPLDWEELLRTGTREEMHLFARRVLGSLATERVPGPLDAGHAWLLLQASAPVKPEALADLGQLYVRGVGVRRNGELSLNLLAAASRVGVQSASDFINKTKVDSNRRRSAETAGQRWQEERRTDALRYQAHTLGMKQEREARRRETLGPEEPPPPPPPPKKKRR